jgi:hypothetical protein
MEKLVFLNQLLKTITDKFRVLTIETESLSESLDIFLTLNDRGQELGPSDIVKGKVMASLGRGLNEESQLGLQEQINLEWNQLTDDVRETETFLRHYLLSTGADKVQKKSVVNLVEVRMRGVGEVPDLQATQSFWSGLKLAGSHYNTIVTCAVKDGQTKLNLKLLEGLQKSHRIFLMSVLGRSDLATGGVLEELIRLTFVLSFRWAAADKGRQSLEDTFHDLAMKTKGIQKDQTETGLTSAMTAEQLVAELKKQVEGVDVDFLKTMSKDIDGSFISRAALYYAQYLTVGNFVAHELGDLHLEHIAPQTPTALWRAELMSDESEGSEYEDVITSIGNLTLLDPALNHKLGNKPFLEKVQEYRKSSMYLTTNLSKFQVWSKQIVKARTKWLSEVFSGVCSVAGTSGSVASFADWYSSQETTPS